jgi:hypothetical protein
MKTIKQYWAIIAGFILAVFGSLYMSKKSSTKKQVGVDNKIKSNKKQVEEIANQIEVIEEKRAVVKTEIVAEKQIIEDLKQQKETITPEVLSTKDAKQNILNKTTRNKKKK